jgi:hypothetical protein
MSGDLKEGMLTISMTLRLLCGWSQPSCILLLLHTVKAVRDKPSYFAERLYKSMKVIIIL